MHTQRRPKNAKWRHIHHVNETYTPPTTALARVRVLYLTKPPSSSGVKGRKPSPCSCSPIASSPSSIIYGAGNGYFTPRTHKIAQQASEATNCHAASHSIATDIEAMTQSRNLGTYHTTSSFWLPSDRLGVHAGSVVFSALE